LDLASDRWGNLPQGWFATAEAEQFCKQAAVIIGDNYGDSQLFVLEYPRICRLLPIYGAVLKGSGREVKVILALRHAAKWLHDFRQ
jgi:hypothetical protein